MAKDPLPKVSHLPQTDEAWEVTVRRMRTWIAPKKEAPYRPYIILVLSPRTGQIVGSDIVDKLPTPDQALNSLVQIMLHPTSGGGKRRRPTVIYIDNEALVKALTPRLEEIGIRCEHRHTLRAVDDVLRSMEQFMTKREPLPGLLRSPGATPFMIKGLFEAAAFFYREAVWRWINDSRPIEVRYPPDAKPRYAVIMGHGGQTHGLAMYTRPDDLRLTYSGMPPERLAGKMEWISLLFGEETEVPFDDLDDMERYGWPVAGKSAYPIPLRISRSGVPSRPGKSELLWFEATLLAIPVFVRKHLRAERGTLRPAETTLTVTTSSGEESIHLRYPVPGFEVPGEEDWETLGDESEAARRRNAELVRAFEQWLARKRLSRKKMEDDLGEIEFFAEEYMAVYGAKIGLARSADQAEATDVDNYLSDWFLENAEWESPEEIKAVIAALQRFYTCLKETGQMPANKANEILNMLRTNRDYYLKRAWEYEENG